MTVQRATTMKPLTGRDFRRLMLINGLAGAGLGLAFTAGVLALDLAGLRSLLSNTRDWFVPVGMLAVGSVITFASVAMGGAIMLLARPETGGRGRPPRLPLVPAMLPLVRRPKSRHPDN
jgi:hypothetical protein